MRQRGDAGRGAVAAVRQRRPLSQHVPRRDGRKPSSATAGPAEQRAGRAGSNEGLCRHCGRLGEPAAHGPPAGLGIPDAARLRCLRSTLALELLAASRWAAAVHLSACDSGSRCAGPARSAGLSGQNQLSVCACADGEFCRSRAVMHTRAWPRASVGGRKALMLESRVFASAPIRRGGLCRQPMRDPYAVTATFGDGSLDQRCSVAARAGAASRCLGPRARGECHARHAARCAASERSDTHLGGAQSRRRLFLVAALFNVPILG